MTMACHCGGERSNNETAKIGHIHRKSARFVQLSIGAINAAIDPHRIHFRVVNRPPTDVPHIYIYIKTMPDDIQEESRRKERYSIAILISAVDDDGLPRHNCRSTVVLWYVLAITSIILG